MAAFSYYSVNAAMHRLLANEDHYSHIYEHRVASVGITLLHEVFSKITKDYQWIYTSEQKEEMSKRIPDYTLEAIDLQNPLSPFPWLHMEFKKIGGDRSYLALNQLANTVAPSLTEVDSTRYLVVMAGYKISFWEIDYNTYYGRNPNYKHLWGCRSLLQHSIYPGDSDVKLKISEGPGEYSINPLVHDDIGGRTPQNALWKEAEKYDTVVLFDLRDPKHGHYIETMFKHMADRRPAGFTDPEMEM